MELTELAALADAAIREVETVIIGKREVVRLSLVALLCNGHVLIEDIPGVGKTMLARTLSAVLGCSFRRIQFTPDLLPGDITGTSIYNQKTSDFEFKPGPVFANVLLADEINRATPKTQSALLEAMEERQITADGTTYPLDNPFIVIATENQIELQGTYPLPEAQLDRFWMRLSIGYPTNSDEISLLNMQADHHPIQDVKPILNQKEIVEMQRLARQIRIAPSLQGDIVELVSKTRKHPQVSLGASPRASLCLMHSSKALAAMQGRSYVKDNDLKELAVPVLAHRLILKPEARVRRWSAEGIIQEILDQKDWSRPLPPSEEYADAGLRATPEPEPIHPQ